MKKLYVILLVVPFLITACDLANRKLADTSSSTTEDSAFMSALSSYIANDVSTCERLDAIAELNVLAKTDAEINLLKEVNVGRILLDKFAAEVDVATLMSNLDDLAAAKENAKATGKTKPVNPNTFLDYMKAVFGDCAAKNSQAKFGALVLVLSEVYRNYSSTIIAAVGNEGIAGAFGDDTAEKIACAQAFDAYVKATLPGIAQIPVGDRIVDHKDAVVKDLPACVNELINPTIYNVQTTVGYGGDISPTYIEGKPGFSQAFQILPWDGYKVEAIFLDGQQLSATDMDTIISNGSLELQNVQANHTIQVNFVTKK